MSVTVDVKVDWWLRLMHFHSMSNIQQYMHMYVVIACNGPKLHMCAYTDNTAMNTDLMVIRN